MPGEDLLIGNDGEISFDENGQLQTTLTVQPALRHQILDLINEWVGDPEAGREVLGILGRNNTEEEAEIDRQNLLRALERMEDAGLIADIEIEIDRDPAGRIGFQVRTRDTQSGSTISFDTLRSFGA